MKTDGTPLHGSYFDLVATKHPDLRQPARVGRLGRPLLSRRRGRLGALPAVFAGALFNSADFDTSYIEVLKTQEEAVRKEPNNPRLIGMYQWSLLETGYFTQALLWGERLKEIEPWVAATHFYLLRLVGFYPRRRTCPSCGRVLADEGARYLVDEHRLECRRCLDSGILLSPKALQYLEVMWKTAPDALAPPETEDVLRELGSFHYRLMQEQLEKDLKSHQVFEDLLRYEKGR